MQTTFSELEYAGKKKRTRRDRFLADIEAVTPWADLVAVIEPHYPKGEGRGRPPIGVLRMLRMYVAQQCFGLSDEGAEDAIYDSQAIRRFVGIDLAREAAPGATTLLKFRRLLEEKQLTESLFQAINARLAERGLFLREGTIVDATLIAAPSSTKNQQRERDPEMHQSKKGNQWYFGMKVHVGADVDCGAVHTVEITAAHEADINVLPKLLRAEDEVIFGDAGYASDEYKRGSRQLGIRWCVQDKRKPGQNLSESQKKRNRKHSSIRARVEHVFRVIKRQFGFTKTRYRGLMKNAVQVNMLMGLANLYLLRRQLMTA